MLSLKSYFHFLGSGQIICPNSAEHRLNLSHELSKWGWMVRRRRLLCCLSLLWSFSASSVRFSRLFSAVCFISDLWRFLLCCWFLSSFKAWSCCFLTVENEREKEWKDSKNVLANFQFEISLEAELICNWTSTLCFKNFTFHFIFRKTHDFTLFTFFFALF